MTPLIAIAALLAAPTWAAKFPSCLPVDKKAAAIITLEELRACQDKALLKFVRATRAKGRTPTNEEFDALDQFQRAEARAVVTRSQESLPELKGPDAKLGGVSPADLSRVNPQTAAVITALQNSLHEAAGNGENGITPAMADEIRAMLIAEQGMLSPEMAELLEAVARDGGKLTSATMKKLQDAGRAAKGQNLDLGIDPKIEKALLESDFSKEQTATPASM